MFGAHPFIILSISAQRAQCEKGTTISRSVIVIIINADLP
jgi:hypothetical protein